MLNRLEKIENKLKELQQTRRHVKLMPLFAFIFTFISFLITLAALNILGYDNDTVLRSDLNGQYIGFISQFLRVIKGENSLWYSFSNYLGSGSILTYAYYSINPFNLLYLIDAVPISTMTAVIIIIKLSLSASTFQLYIQNVLKQDRFYTIIFSCSYALCGYAASMHHNIMWLDSLYLLPIIIILICRLVDTGKSLLLVPAFAYLFITNFYMAFIVGIFTAIVFIAYSFYRFDFSDRSSWKKLLRHGLVLAGCVILAAGLCAVILLPTALFLFSNMAPDNFAFKPLDASLVDMINSMFVGQMQTLDTRVPLLYCGLPSLGLLPFYFFNKEITSKEKLYHTAIILFLVVSMLYLPMYKFMHAFDYPNYYGYRFAFLLVFVVITLACRESAFVTGLPLKSLGLYCLFLIFFYSFMVGYQQMAYYGLKTNSQEELIVNAIFLFLWFLSVFLLQTKPSYSSIISVAMVLIITAELSVNGYICIDKVEHAAIHESSFNQYYYSAEEAVNTIKDNDSGFYRLRFNNNSNYNAPSLFGFAGLTTFSSSDNYNLRYALSHLGLVTSNRFITEYGSTEITDMLFGAKYYIDMVTADPGTGITASNYIPATITDNPYALSLGYMVSPLIEEYEAQANPFYNQIQLIYSMTGELYVPYELILMDDILVEYDNMAMSYNAGSIDFYALSNAYGGGHVSFSVPTRDGQTFMMCFFRSNPLALSGSAYVVARSLGMTDAITISYGAIHQALSSENYEDENYEDESYDTIMLEFNNNNTLTDYCENIFAYYYDPSLLPEIYEDLSRGNMEIQSFTNDTIIGTVTSTAERPVLFTSIPYEDGWEAYVDGNPTDIYPVMGDAFLALVLTPGEHTVKLHYTAPGSEIGLLISEVSGILFLIVIFLGRYRSSQKRSSVKKEQKNSSNEETQEL